MDRSTFLAQLHQQYELPPVSLAELVERVTGHHITEIRRLVRGDENEVYRVSLVTGSAVFVRAGFPGCRAMKMRAEAEVMQRARIAGVPVPEVRAVESLASEQGVRPTMVLEEAAGFQLATVLPTLTGAERASVMQNLGHLLGLLCTSRLPGHGRPDEHGEWPDPEADRRRYLAAVRADSQRLGEAGLTSIEVREISRILDTIATTPIVDDPILCHGDISAEHLFIDGNQAVVGLIDWGMWSGGSPADEIAALSTRLGDADLAAVLAHHPNTEHIGDEFRQQIAISLLTQSIGGLAWLIRSGQSDQRQRLTTAIRHSVRDLRNIAINPKGPVIGSGS